jgi:RNA polymerase sigma-70 factor (ECF subfamily)
MTDRVWRERGLRDAVLAGDDRAWRAWFEQEYAPLESYVLWRCGSLSGLADDVVQETWITAVRKIRRFDPEAGSFHRWLCGIAANVIRNQLRSRRRRTARLELLNGTADREDLTVQQRDQAEQVARALAQLQPRHEEALRMKYLERMSVAEIATAWGETEKAVESVLSRARDAFREAYEHE